MSSTLDHRGTYFMLARNKLRYLAGEMGCDPASNRKFYE